jgi:hypothetical protein
MTALTGTSAEAAPTPQALRCGQSLTTVTSEYYLDRDLTCSSGFRVIQGTGTEDDPIGRNISIDLRGHSLKGTGTGTAIDAYDYPAFNGLMVRNGRIENWGRGIVVHGFAEAKKVSLSKNIVAMICDGGTCGVTDSILHDNRRAVTVWEGSIEVTGSLISGSEVGLTTQAFLDGATLRYSAFTGNKVAVQLNGGGMQSLFAHRNVFTANGTGVRGEVPQYENESDHRTITLTENTFLANSDGVYLPIGPPEARAVIARNIAVKNKRYGIYAPGATDGGGNKVVGNGRPCVGVACSRP